MATDPNWRAEWAAAAAAARLHTAGGGLLDSAQAVTSIADKRILYEASSAVAVDMESYAVAGVAAGAGVPFVAARAIADPAGRCPDRRSAASGRTACRASAA